MPRSKTTPPEDFHAYYCGAQLRGRPGVFCKQRKLTGRTRCKLHGGRYDPEQVKTAALRHGVYAKSMTTEEVSMLATLEFGSIDAELSLCRLRLRRALEAEQKEMERVQELDRLQLAEYSSETPTVHGMPVEGAPPVVKKRYKATDYGALVDRFLHRIESLEKTRAELQRAAKESAAQDITPVSEIVVRVQTPGAATAEDA